MNGPFFSVIIPTFNREQLVIRAVNSLLEQDFTDFEIIVVDDGSTDNTETEILKITDQRVRYFKKSNEERNIARNYGFRQSKGQYIGFLDSDDFVYPHHLRTAHQWIKKKKTPEWIFLNYESRNSQTSQSQVREDFGLAPEKKLITDNFVQANGVFIRKDIFSGFHFLESRSAVVGEDHFLWLRLASRFPLHIEPKPTSVVWEHPERSLRNINLEKLERGVNEIISALRADATFLLFYKRKARWYFAFRLCFIALVAVDHKKFNYSVRYLLKSLWMYPFIFMEKRFLATLKNSLLGILRLGG